MSFLDSKAEVDENAVMLDQDALVVREKALTIPESQLEYFIENVKRHFSKRRIEEKRATKMEDCLTQKSYASFEEMIIDWATKPLHAFPAAMIPYLDQRIALLEAPPAPIVPLLDNSKKRKRDEDNDNTLDENARLRKRR